MAWVNGKWVSSKVSADGQVSQSDTAQQSAPSMDVYDPNSGMSQMEWLQWRREQGGDQQTQQTQQPPAPGYTQKIPGGLWYGPDGQPYDPNTSGQQQGGDQQQQDTAGTQDRTAAGTAVTDFRTGQDSPNPWNMAGQIGQPRYKPVDWEQRGQDYNRDLYNQTYGTWDQQQAARKWANRQDGMFQQYGGEQNFYNTPEYQAYLNPPPPPPPQPQVQPQPQPPAPTPAPTPPPAQTPQQQLPQLGDPIPLQVAGPGGYGPTGGLSPPLPEQQAQQQPMLLSEAQQYPQQQYQQQQVQGQPPGKGGLPQGLQQYLPPGKGGRPGGYGRPGGVPGTIGGFGGYQGNVGQENIYGTNPAGGMTISTPEQQNLAAMQGPPTGSYDYGNNLRDNQTYGSMAEYEAAGLDPEDPNFKPYFADYKNPNSPDYIDPNDQSNWATTGQGMDESTGIPWGSQQGQFDRYGVPLDQNGYEQRSAYNTGKPEYAQQRPSSVWDSAYGGNLGAAQGQWDSMDPAKKAQYQEAGNVRPYGGQQPNGYGGGKGGGQQQQNYGQQQQMMGGMGLNNAYNQGGFGGFGGGYAPSGQMQGYGRSSSGQMQGYGGPSSSGGKGGGYGQQQQQQPYGGGSSGGKGGGQGGYRRPGNNSGKGG